MMAFLLRPILAATAVNPIEQLGVPTASRNVLGMRVNDMLLILSVASLLTAALVIWALYIRKPKSDLPRTRVYKSHQHVEERDDGTIRKRKKHRRPRRAHRGRNATLSEAGGLPPLRSDGSVPPI